MPPRWRQVAGLAAVAAVVLILLFPLSARGVGYGSREVCGSAAFPADDLARHCEAAIARTRFVAGVVFVAGSGILLWAARRDDASMTPPDEDDGWRG